MFKVVARWFVSVGAKIFRVVPNATLLLIVLSFSSQVFSLLSALLPLKVIILLGSDHVPAYFPDFMHALERSALISGLCVTTVVFFALHLLCEHSIRRVSSYGARALISSSRKLTLFDGQEKILAKGYQRIADALSASVFVVLSGMALAVVYWLQAVVVFSYISFVFVGAIVVNRYSLLAKARSEENFMAAVGVVANVGFYLVFACIAVDILSGSKVSAFWAIVSLLLVRQIFKRCASLVGDVSGVYKQRLELNALLFQGHVYTAQAHAVVADSLWALAHPDSVLSWMEPIFLKSLGFVDKTISLKMQQTGYADILQWQVTVGEGDGAECYLVKLFGRSKSSMARHEASLLSVMGSHLNPLPQLCMLEQVEDFHCHVYRWPVVGCIDLVDSKVAPMQLVESLMRLSPSSSLVAVYARSHPMMWNRLGDDISARLLQYAQVSDLFCVEQWKEVRKDILLLLQRLPLTLATADLPLDAMGRDSKGNIWASQWGRWSLEPIGAGWPINAKALPLLERAFTEACRERPELQAFSFEEVRLSALVFAFDRACQRHTYRTATELLAPIISSYEVLRRQRVDFVI